MFGGLDRWADGWLERLRGVRAADAVFTVASDLGDFSVIWHMIGAARGLRDERRAHQAFALSILLGGESLLVNQGIKRLFRRNRPTESGDSRYQVRRPSTSSFPSGHASSAFFAASLLSHWSGRTARPVWFVVAAVVATSRAYVRIHHPSDVVAGAVLGVGTGHAAVRLVREMPRLG